jgi:hypothetical protein
MLDQREDIMKTTNIVLGSVALILASNVATEAALLVAGPLPANVLQDQLNTVQISCQAINTTTVGGSRVVIAIDIVDVDGNGNFGLLCPPAANDATCGFIMTANAIGRSPYSCYFTPVDDNTHPIAGTICSQPVPGSGVGDVSNLHCLQAVPRE